MRKMCSVKARSMDRSFLRIERVCPAFFRISVYPCSSVVKDLSPACHELNLDCNDRAGVGIERRVPHELAVGFELGGGRELHHVIQFSDILIFVKHGAGGCRRLAPDEAESESIVALPFEETCLSGPSITRPVLACASAPPLTWLPPTPA